MVELKVYIKELELELEDDLTLRDEKVVLPDEEIMLLFLWVKARVGYSSF